MYLEKIRRFILYAGSFFFLYSEFYAQIVGFFVFLPSYSNALFTLVTDKNGGSVAVR